MTQTSTLEREKAVFEDMKWSWKTFQEIGVFTDIDFYCQDASGLKSVKVSAHRSILFQHMLDLKTYADCGGGVVIMPDVKASAFNILLEFLYLGEIRVNRDEGLEELINYFATVFRLDISGVLDKGASSALAPAAPRATPAAAAAPAAAAPTPTRIDQTNIKQEPQQYDCSLCGESFQLQLTLDKHLHTTHNKAPAKPNKCNHCIRRFRKKTNLSRHMKRKHPNVADAAPATGKDIRCKVCAYTCSSKQTILEHINSEHPEHLKKKSGGKKATNVRKKVQKEPIPVVEEVDIEEIEEEPTEVISIDDSDNEEEDDVDECQVIEELSMIYPMTLAPKHIKKEKVDDDDDDDVIIENDEPDDTAEHEQESFERDEACPLCSKALPKSRFRWVHILTHYKKDLKKHFPSDNGKCELCNNYAASKPYFVHYHILMTHPEAIQYLFAPEVKSFLPKNTASATSNRNVECYLCSKPELTSMKLKEHMATVHFPDEIRKEFGLQRSDKRCPICQNDKEFQSNSGVVRHLGAVHKLIIKFIPDEVYASIFGAGETCDSVASHAAAAGSAAKAASKKKSVVSKTAPPKTTSSRKTPAESGGPAPHKCSECGDEFRKISLLNSHRRTWHGKLAAATVTAAVAAADSGGDARPPRKSPNLTKYVHLGKKKSDGGAPMPPPPPSQSCYLCKAPKANKVQLKEHLVLNHFFKQIEARIETITKIGDGSSKCPYCDQARDSYQDVVSHIGVHHEALKYMLDDAMTKSLFEEPDSAMGGSSGGVGAMAAGGSSSSSGEDGSGDDREVEVEVRPGGHAGPAGNGRGLPKPASAVSNNPGSASADVVVDDNANDVQALDADQVIGNVVASWAKSQMDAQEVVVMDDTSEPVVIMDTSEPVIEPDIQIAGSQRSGRMEDDKF